jgi:predicted transcriptional regulator
MGAAMNEPISRIMTKTVWTAAMEDTAEKVEELLNRRSLSAVPIVDEKGGVFGIVSAADILHLHAAKRNPKTIRAWELCTYKPIAVSPETPVDEVARLMIQNKIHHVPVIERSKLCGIVSALDFVERFVLKDGT